MKTGLVLEGGGIRGIFSAGVMDVLMEEGIVFDGAVGVSAGAAFGCNYKSGQNRRSIRYNLKFARDPRYSSLRSLLTTGDLFNAQFCYHDIPEKLFPFDMEAFRENPMEFYIVCTDVETGKPVYHLCEKDEDEHEMLEWFRASGSMPMVSRVVEVGGFKLLDGGISDSIPLRFMEEQGYDRNLVILTRPADYVKKPVSMMPLIRRVLREYPAVVEGLENRHLVYNEEVAYVRQREAGKYALVIRPDTELDIGRVEHDRFKIRAVYKEGRKKARRMLPAIRRFLADAKKASGQKPPFTEIKPSSAEEGVYRSAVSSSRSEEDLKRKVVSPAPPEEGIRGKAVSPSPSGEDHKGNIVKPSLVDDPAFNAAYIYSDGADEPLYSAAAENKAEADRRAEDTERQKYGKKYGREFRSVLVGDSNDEQEPFEKPFPAGKLPDIPVDQEPFGTSSISRRAADEQTSAFKEQTADQQTSVPAEQAADQPEVPVENVSIQVGSVSLNEFESPASESVLADKALAEDALAEDALADGNPVDDDQNRWSPVIAGNKKRWKRRNWKPGEMTSLKQKND